MVQDPLYEKHLNWLKEEFGAEPFFESRGDYEAFRIRFGEKLAPELGDNARRRAKSELWSMTHYVC